MSGSIRFDKSDFTETMRKLAAQSTRDLPTFITSRLFHISKKARDNTPKASRPKILSDLAKTVVIEKVTKSGKNKGKVRKQSYKGTPLVYAIINARQRRLGKAPFTKDEMKAAAGKEISNRLRAIGSLRAGWARGLGILASRIAQFYDRGGPRVKQPSTAKPAQDGWSPTAEIEYRVTVNNRSSPQIDQRVATGLDTAFNQEKGEMLQRLDQKMNEIARKAGAI